VYKNSQTAIGPDETSGEVRRTILARVGAALLLEVIEDMVAGRAAPETAGTTRPARTRRVFRNRKA